MHPLFRSWHAARGESLFQTAAAKPDCYHSSAGPPLEAIIFERNQSDVFEQYASSVLQAVDRIRTQIPGLSLNGRVAIVVPDQGFLQSFQIWWRKSNPLTLISAEAASRVVTYMYIYIYIYRESESLFVGLSVTDSYVGANVK